MPQIQNFHSSRLPTKYERLFWSISFLTSATLAAYLLSAQFSRFIEAPTVMSVEMDYFNWNVSYPAFTLCPYLKTTDASFGRLLNKTLLRTGRDLEAYLFAIVSAGMDSLDALDLQLEKPEILSLIDPNEYANIASSAFRNFDDELLTTNMDMPVTITNVMTELGMCHVINSNVGVFDNPFKWYSDIKYRKTNIEISVYEKDFFTQIINYAEVYKVLIHSPDEIALSTTPSYSHYLKGFLTFGIQVSSIRISDNLRTSGIGLRKCRFTNEPISKRYPVYSYNHCLLECRIQMILKLCGCIPHFYKAIDDEKICNLGELSCVVKYKKEILTLSASEETRQKFNYNERLPKNSSDCGCLSNCEIDIYQKEDESLRMGSGNERNLTFNDWL
ncbi:uncharacterized protein LOC113234923 [Hyposmocoma kahamanoa]|uniref:uncharacterized protein LOC113234923 n=1 Tax=Hyposmocoma kahamanoa TaxID=1477025 RepID=UPI000E6D866D|nr:uncharacterized protein LOC113234923 [Hyposmocoma kahamanoa]